MPVVILTAHGHHPPPNPLHHDDTPFKPRPRPQRRVMPASREKAPNEPSEAHTAESKRTKTHLEIVATGSNPPQSRTTEIQKPKPGAI